MIDQYGRTIEYLRISVTDRCNLRCVYCMPEEGIEQLPHEQILTFDEIERICRISTELGISKIKLTTCGWHILLLILACGIYFYII